MCPSCQSPKNPRHYLCLTCWRQLPAATRTALYRRDDHAALRLLLLLQEIRRQVPLSEIRIQEGNQTHDAGTAAPNRSRTRATGDPHV